MVKKLIVNQAMKLGFEVLKMTAWLAILLYPFDGASYNMSTNNRVRPSMYGTE